MWREGTSGYTAPTRELGSELYGGFDLRPLKIVNTPKSGAQSNRALVLVDLVRIKYMFTVKLSRTKLGTLPLL
jgi:hypothetical protein